MIVLGDVVYDLLVEPEQPVAVGDDTRARITCGPGGAGANVAVWLARLGVETYLAGRIGCDMLGRELHETLAADEVRLHLTVDESRPTGKIVVLIGAAGERTMISDRGANLGLSLDDLPVALFTQGSHLHLSGYSFFEPATRLVAHEALRLARQAGMTASIDPASAAQLRHIGPDEFIRWTAGCDLCFPNLDEGRVLTGADLPNDVAAALLRNFGAVALKLGAHGAIYAGSQAPRMALPAGAAPNTNTTPARSQVEPMASPAGLELAADMNGSHQHMWCIALPAQPAQVVDTTGAGDAFSAAFLASWLASNPPMMALRQALTLAAQVVGHVGAR